jgi:peptidyl-prolyl cis-trans isomerase SDCCAG10
MEADIRALAKRAGGGEDSDDERAAKKPKTSALAAELAKYAGARVGKKGKKRGGEDDVLGMLSSFRTKLQQTPALASAVDDEGAEELVPEEGREVDDDAGFLAHALQFHKGNEEEVAKAERDYEVIDPRARGARAKEEERERKAADKRSRPAPGAPRRR